MHSRRRLALVMFICGALAAAAASSGFGADSTDIAVLDTPDHEIRFTSGKTVYVEGLVGDQWVGRYWAADGHINFPYWRFADPAFKIEVKDDPTAATGTSVPMGWQWVSAAEAPPTERGARHFVVELSNTTRPMKVKVHTLLDGTPVLVRWIEITNTADKPVALTAVSPWSGRLWPRVHPFTLGYCDPATVRDWPYWFQFEWKPLSGGTTLVESVKGNGYDDPFFIVRNEDTGEYFIGHLAWSANWRLEFQCEGGLSFQFGPSAVNALRVMAPGETIQTPATHLGHVEGDLDTTVQAMHDHIRRFVLPGRPAERSFLIQYSAPADQGYYRAPGAYNETNVKKCMDVAAAIGAELFFIDQGWWDVYGEWVPSPTRFPHGLEPLIEYAHKKGLQFGIYAEVEGGRGNWDQSKVFREHRDWFLPQNVLDLGRPEVAAWMESEFTELIDRYHPEMYRHDYIPYTPEAQTLYTYEGASTLRDGFMENNYWRYYEAFYRFSERMHAKYPDLVLQMCANGGTREDLDMMSRWHETYTQEGEPLYVLPSYSGKTLALPPEILVMGLGAQPERGHLDTHLRCAFTLSTPWLLTSGPPSVEELSPEVQSRYLHYANIYKTFIRPLWPTCKIYHHDPVNSRGGSASGPWFAMEFASPGRNKGWATIVRLGESESETYLFKPRGLDPGRTYRVTFDSTGTAATIEGWQLVRDGIAVRLEAVMSSELLLFDTQ